MRHRHKYLTRNFPDYDYDLNPPYYSRHVDVDQELGLALDAFIGKCRPSKKFTNQTGVLVERLKLRLMEHCLCFYECATCDRQLNNEPVLSKDFLGSRRGIFSPPFECRDDISCSSFF